MQGSSERTNGRLNSWGLAVDRLVDFLTLAASAATAIGVIIAARQLGLSKEQARIQFEDGLNAQYRSIVQHLPVEALLGEALSPEAHRAALPYFYHYFDLCNEQAFLRKRGRIGSATWENWKEGIEQNCRRPAFAAAWADVSRRAPESFDDLRVMVPVLRLPA